jgi:hypothetical protein
VLREMYSDVYLRAVKLLGPIGNGTCNGTVFTSLGIRPCMSSTSTSSRECEPERGTENGDTRDDFSEGKVNQ